jgi:leucine-zipper of insertion element IS481
MADIVDDFLTRLQQHVPNVPMEQLVKLESGLRQTHGGTEPYVGKRLSLTTRTFLVARGLQRQRPLAEVFAQAGVARRTGYRILGSK